MLMVFRNFHGNFLVSGRARVDVLLVLRINGLFRLFHPYISRL